MNTEALKVLEMSLKNKTQIDNDVMDLMKEHNFNSLVDASNFKCKQFERVKLLSDDNVAVYCIYWAKGSYSPPHDHPEGGCILKIIYGKLNETNYSMDKDKITLKNNTILTKGTVGTKYSNELHSIEAIDDTVSLHIYFPGDYKPKYFSVSNDL